MIAIERATKPRIDRLAAALGRVGGVLGLVAGTVELTVGSSIRSWIGEKDDTTRLGIVTFLLAAVALSSAVALARSGRSLQASRRLAIVVGMLVPGLVCFTTVGRLWYVPGALLVAAGCLAAVGLRGSLRIVARDIERNGARILALALAVLYLGLGVAALGTSGILGVVGSLVVINLLLLDPRLPRFAGLGIVVAATAPFAVATWWSLITPLVAVLLVVIAWPAMRPQQDRSRPRPHTRVPDERDGQASASESASPPSEAAIR